MDGVCGVVAAGAGAGLGPKPPMPRGPWGGRPSCDMRTSALGSGSMNQGRHSGFPDRCEGLRWFLAAARDQGVGLSGIKRWGNNKGRWRANSLQYKKKGKMKADIIRNTFWGAVEFELGIPLTPNSRRSNSNMETNGNS